MTEQFPEQEQHEAPDPDTDTDAGDVDQDAQPTTGEAVGQPSEEPPGADVPE